LETICKELNQIVKITKSELIYREHGGDLFSIDLQKCRNNYLVPD